MTGGVRGLPFEAVEGLVSVVLVGATELIIYGLPRILAVLVDSGALPRLAAAPERLDQAIDEGFCVVTPSNVVLRAVARDCEVMGHRFRRGERVLVAIRNATRQHKHFNDPDVFDLDRNIPPSLRRLPFGAGAHACIGASLALAEARHVLGAIAALDGRLTILERGRNRGKIYPGYTRLLMRLEGWPAP